MAKLTKSSPFEFADFSNSAEAFAGAEREDPNKRERERESRIRQRALSVLGVVLVVQIGL